MNIVITLVAGTGLAVLGASMLDRSMRRNHELMYDLRGASRAKSEFLANMSHEIRHADERGDRHDELPARHGLQPASSASASRPSAPAATAYSSIINDVLDFSKIEAGQTRSSAHRSTCAAASRTRSISSSQRAADKVSELLSWVDPRFRRRWWGRRATPARRCWSTC